MAEQFITQDNVNLTITTPAGKDVLLIDELTGFEQISALFEFHLKLHATINDIDFQKLIGQEVQITFDCKSAKRYFCGVVGEFSQGQSFDSKEGPLNRYEAKIYPNLWLLKFNSDHRIFQNKSTIDIIKQIFQDNSLQSFTDKTTQCGKGIRDYCVQYGESAFDFVSRLMEEEGIFYFFEHTADGHKLILADANSSFTKKPSDSVPLVRSASSEPAFNKMLFCSLHEQVVAKKFATGDYNYEISTTPFKSDVEGKGVGGKVYRYPGIYSKSADGDSRATLQIQALEWAKETLEGRSTALEMTAGYQFMLSEHIRKSMNKAYVAYRVEHLVHTQSERRIYENSFIAFDLQANFSPMWVTPKPRIYGTQTAVVTGKAGEEIWTDKFGRVFVQFHWDRLGQKDEKSSCPIRVAQTWAMGTWGTLFTPRIGQEVVVSFIDGDPDRPLITGCVYNVDNLPPYLPDEPTKSTIKTNTSKGGAGFNEIRFEDKKDSEQIFVHAQKDMDRVVKANRTLLIEEGNDTDTLKKGDRTITLTEGNLSITLSKGNETRTLTDGNLTLTLDKGDETHTITGAQTFKVTKDHTLEAKNITIKASGDITLDAGGSITMKSGTSMTVTAGTSLSMKSGTDASLSAGTELSIKSGTNAQISGGLQLQLKGTLGATVDGGPMLALKSSAMADIQGPAMVKVTGGMIKLQGMVMFG